MKKVILILLFVVSYLHTEMVNISYVTDGDTIKYLKDGNDIIIRLAGIDTPETYRSKKLHIDANNCNIQSYVMIHLGLMAKEYLIDNYLGKNIVIVKIGMGRYRRDIAYLPGITEDMVRLGLCVVEDYHNVDSKIMDNLFKLEKEAKINKIGIWRYLKTKCM